MSSILRYFFITMLSVFLIWTGAERERKILMIKNGSLTLVNRYPKMPTGDYQTQLKGLTGFHPSPKLQSSIFFSLIFMCLATAIFYLLTLSVNIAKTTFVIYLGFMLLCFLLLKLGTTGIDYRLSIGLSHYLEDLFLSPFLILATVVLFRFTGLIKK